MSGSRRAGTHQQNALGPDETKSLREHLLYLLRGGGAHVDFDRAVAGLPVKLRGVRPKGLPHSPWRLVEHMRLAQWDILRFCVDPQHISPAFPEGYWPAGDAPPTRTAWDKSVASFRADLKALQDLLSDPATDLFIPLP